uniref:RING-type domain-containing protein n=1 Tax=Mesocestoides corti TaxID=53468 RepID=A0A5K3ESP9_MESCO
MDDKSTSSPVSFPDLGDELMLLKSAFPTELTINSSDQGLLLTVQITPGVSNVPVNVLFALKIFCPLKYPSVSPVVTISDPVGLSDSALSDLQSDIAAIIESHETELVIFPLIECCRDFISGNIPSVDCSICFDAFQTESDVYRSRCNHFFHKACISAYHDSFRNAHNHEMALLLAKNPHCPKEMRPKFEFLCPLCKTILHPAVDLPEDFNSFHS